MSETPLTKSQKQYLEKIKVFTIFFNFCFLGSKLFRKKKMDVLFEKVYSLLSDTNKI